MLSYLFYVDYTFNALVSAPGQNLTPADQLSLTMAWQRPDIARTRVLVNVNDWSVSYQLLFNQFPLSPCRYHRASKTLFICQFVEASIRKRYD